jgi:pilus assembly protein CpaB
LKRSNRLVLLVGVFLAIVAFVAIIFVVGRKDPGPAVVTDLPTVVATADIPLGTEIRADQVTVQDIAITGRDTDAFGSVTQVVGKIARQKVTTGAAITAKTLSGGTEGQVLQIDCPPTKRCMSVQVDQVTGVGTVIKTGDYVDMIVGFQAEKFPVITVNPVDDSFTVVSGINGTSVKLLIQGLQVQGTLLPPAPQQAEGAAPDTGTALTGQQQIVILDPDAQQSEIIKFAQLDGSISLALRSPQDFIDPLTNLPFPNGPVPDATTGIILKILVDIYGVLPPEMVETILPAQGG